MKYVLTAFIVWILTGGVLTAQVQVGAGVEVSSPLMFNPLVRGHNHAGTVAGAHVTLGYAPPEGNFTGALIAGFSPMILPVVRFNNDMDVLYMNFANTHISLLGRFRKRLNNEGELLFGPGVGVNFLKGNKVQVSQRSDNEIARTIEDSSFYNQATLPAFYLNVEYMKAVKPGSRIFFGIGVQLQYIYFLDQGTKYRVDIMDKNYQYYKLQPELKGHMLNPMGYVNIYYRL